MKTLDKIGVILFGFFAVICSIGAIWNRSQIAIAALCAIMALTLYFDMKKEIKS